MSIKLLLSGRTVSVQTERNVTVHDFKQSAQSLSSVGKARLVTTSGRVVEGASTIGECGLISGGSITLHVAQLKILATRRCPHYGTPAIVVTLGDGSVVCELGGRR